VPAIHAEPLLRLVDPVGPDHLVQPRVRRSELLVLLGLLVLEIVRAAEIILGARAADRGELLVAVHKELDLPFAPPTVGIHAPSQVRAHVLAFPPNAFQDRVILLGRQRVDAAELGVEIGRIGGHVGQHVVDLVVHPHRLMSDVGHRDAAVLAEGHLPVAVKRAAGVNAHGQRRNLGVLAPAHTEEVAHGAFDRRLLLAVPVEPQDALSPVAGRRHPNLLDRAGALDLGQRERLAGRDVDGRRELPASTQVPGRGGVRTFGRHSAFALFAREVLRADRARLGVGQPRQVAQVHAQAAERSAAFLRAGRNQHQPIDHQTHGPSDQPALSFHDPFLSLEPLDLSVIAFFCPFSSFCFGRPSSYPLHSAGPIRKLRNQTSSLWFCSPRKPLTRRCLISAAVFSSAAITSTPLCVTR